RAEPARARKSRSRASRGPTCAPKRDSIPTHTTCKSCLMPRGRGIMAGRSGPRPRGEVSMRKLALGLAVSLLSSTALAAPKKAPVQAPPPEIAGLDADDAVIVRESIESLGMLGTPAAAEAIAARLSRGLPRDLTLVALDALGILQQRVAVPVVE